MYILKKFNESFFIDKLLFHLMLKLNYKNENEEQEAMNINMVSKLKQLTKPFLFFTLTTFTCSAYAEYYIVYPPPSVPCMGACYVHHIHKRCTYHHVKKHPVKKCKKPKRVYYVPSCTCTCKAVWAHRPCSPCCGPRNYGYVYREPMAVSYYYYADYRYNPDLATGDDYQSLHPDMNIDY